MGNEMYLMQRLAVSKKIMERTEQIKTGSIDSRSFNIPKMDEYEPVNAKYNVPQEFLPESTTQKTFHDPPLRTDPRFWPVLAPRPCFGLQFDAF